MKLKATVLIALLGMVMVSFGQLPAAEQTTKDQSLKILSWNIHMLPHKIMNTGQSARAEIIGKQLKDKDYDVIVFQEAFDKNARELLGDILKENFPYQRGPINLNGSPFRLNGGVWVVSKYPMKELGEIKYSVGSGFDAFARKGAILVELVKNGKTYQVAGTHLQSDDGKKQDRERIVQYSEMINKLLIPFKNDTIPQIVCGDFNTSRRDLNHYQRLVRSMETVENAGDNTICDKDICQNMIVPGAEKYTWDYSKNDLIPGPCEITTYDYIFVRKNKLAFRNINRNVREFSGNWKEKGKDKTALSDHFAMEIEVVPDTKSGTK